MRAHHRRVAHERAAVDRLEAVGAEGDHELAIRPALPARRIDSAPYIPPAIDCAIEGEWSWYGHTPAVAAGPQAVRPGPARVDLPSRPEKPGTYAPSDDGL